VRRGIVGVQLLTEALVLNQTLMCARLLEHQTVKWRIVLKGCHEFRIPSPDSNSIGRYRELRPGLGNTKDFSDPPNPGCGMAQGLLQTHLELSVASTH